MTWTLPWAILFLLGLLLLLGYFLSKKVFPAGHEEPKEPVDPKAPTCESCGVAGCGGFAKALVRGGGEEPDSARDGSSLGRPDGCPAPRNLAEQKAQVAYVRCQGTRAEARYLYSGAHNCQAAAGMEATPKACRDACLGFGDCVEVCSPRAIRIHQGIASIDPARCNGCGDCIPACPVGLIETVPATGSLEIACRALHSIPSEGLCPDGCTGCGDCVEACPERALLKDGSGIPYLIRDLCTGCGRCVDACPRKIFNYRGSGHNATTHPEDLTATDAKVT